MTQKKWKNWTQKLLIIGPDPFIPQSSPDHSPELMLNIMKSRDQTSVLLSVQITNHFASLLTSIKTKYSEKIISCQNGGTNISWLDILLSNLDLFRDHVSKLLIVKDSLDFQLSLEIVKGWVQKSTNYLFTFANTSHWSWSTIGNLPQNSSTKFEKKSMAQNQWWPM